MKNLTPEVVVVGGGPAGLTAAIAFATAGVETVLVGKKTSTPDHRTTALLEGSVKALDTLGIWGRCREHAAPLRFMRIVDCTARLLRAPEVCFAASEIGLDAFGQNIENHFLLAALEAQVPTALTRIEDEGEMVEIEADQVIVRTTGRAVISARLAIGAEGRRSMCRAAAGIDVDGFTYPQSALTFNVRHRRPHHDTSTEFHTESGPFTLVPLLGRRSSLVLVAEPAEAARLCELSDAEMAAEIERCSHSILGKIEIEPGRGIFPLAVATVTRLGAQRVALVGEAAHIFPPIGAQGLNLGLRDAATIAELVVAAHREGRDIGGPDLTDRYDRLRRADVMSRTLAVDILNRSLLSNFLPLQAARGLGLFLLGNIDPLRRAVMREGVRPQTSQPRLMRGETL